MMPTDPLQTPPAKGWVRVKTELLQNGPHGPAWSWHWPTAILRSADYAKGVCIVDVPAEDVIAGCKHDPVCGSLYAHLDLRYGNAGVYKPSVL